MLAGQRTTRFALGPSQRSCWRFSRSSAFPALRTGTSLVAVLAAAFIIALVVGFSASLLAEVLRPTIATAREAERAVGAPVLATIRARERPAPADRIDPVRMLLSRNHGHGSPTPNHHDNWQETGSGGDHKRETGACGGVGRKRDLGHRYRRRRKLGGRVFRSLPEPGFTDAVAGVRLWREVARPISARASGLAIDVVPAGSLRQDVRKEDTRARAAKSEFNEFREQYDLCILVAPSVEAASHVRHLVETPSVVICAVLGRTGAEALRSEAAQLRVAGAQVLGVVAWDGEPPALESRNVLMAKVLAQR